jgi:glycosyltransferase involved in cell wall biosynthesis
MSVDAGAVRVLIVLPADPERMRIGGIASFVRGFVKFAPEDFRLGFVGVTTDRRVGRWGVAELEGRRLDFFPAVRGAAERRGRVPLALRFTAALFAYRRRLRFDSWIASFHRPATDLPFHGAAAPMWRVVHLSVEDLGTEGSESRWRSIPRLLQGFERRAFRRMDRIYVVNERAADRYRERFPEVRSRIRFLPNWADPTIFHPETPERRAALRARLGEGLELGPDGPILLFAGRLEGQKDPLLLARAYARLAGRRANARLLVAGEGSLGPAMRRELDALGVLDRTRFLGTVSRERLGELMNASDVLAISSGFETGPTVGLESLACGLPVVTTPVGEVARLVAASGAGHVSGRRTPDAVAEALEETLSRPQEALRAVAVEAAAPYLAHEVLGEVYAYNRSLAQQRRAGAPGLDPAEVSG